MANDVHANRVVASTQRPGTHPVAFPLIHLIMNPLHKLAERVAGTGLSRARFAIHRST